MAVAVGALVGVAVLVGAAVAVEVALGVSVGKLLSGPPIVGASPAEEQQYILRGTDSLDFPPGGVSDITEGYYVITVTRQDVDKGTTSGDFILQVIPLDADGG